MFKALAIAVLLCSAALGQSKPLSVAAGLIEIPLNPSGASPEIDITWEAREPIDLQYRVYEDGHVFVTYALAGSRLVIQSDIIDWEKRQRQKINWIVTVGDGPPTTVPFPSDGFAVMVIREASQMGALPVAQRSIFTSAEVANYLRARCIKLSDGNLAARFFDDDFSASDLQKTPETMRLAYAAAKRDSQGLLPWIVISNGSTGYSGALPANITDMLTLLRKYGG